MNAKASIWGFLVLILTFTGGVRAGITQTAFLKASNTGDGDFFGRAVSLSGDTVVIGAVGEDGSNSGVNTFPYGRTENAGAAYVFVRDEAGWSQQAFLKAHNNPQVTAEFGQSVSVSDDTIVVGAPGENSNTPGGPNAYINGAGAAYVFVRSGTVWTQQAYLKKRQPRRDEHFGYSVSLAGDTLVVGAPRAVDSEQVTRGTAYIFTRSGAQWTEQAELKPQNGGSDIGFGRAVSISGNAVVVGAPYHAGYAGAAWVFVRQGTEWPQQARLQANNAEAGDLFGTSVSVSGDSIAVGALFEDSGSMGVNSIPDESATYAGAAYVFVRSGSEWSQQAYLKANNTGAGDRFGWACLSGDTLVVGASGESSSGTGVNSIPNEEAAYSGAAYVFVRSGTQWSQQAFLKAGNTGPDDDFGGAVSVSGDTVVAGGVGESSSGTGVNSTPNEDAEHSGAAYIFSGVEPVRDTDGDGLADFVETYLGTPPGTPNGYPWRIWQSATLTSLIWPEAAPAGYTVTPQWSPDMVTWLASGQTLNTIPARTIEVGGAGGNLQQATINTTGLDRVYLRRKIARL